MQRFGLVTDFPWNVRQAADLPNIAPRFSSFQGVVCCSRSRSETEVRSWPAHSIHI